MDLIMCIFANEFIHREERTNTVNYLKFIKIHYITKLFLCILPKHFPIKPDNLTIDALYPHGL